MQPVNARAAIVKFARFAFPSAEVATPPGTRAKRRNLCSFGAALFSFGLLLGCKASVQGEANAGRTKAEAKAQAFSDLSEKGVEGDGINDFAITPEEISEEGALLGARHDVFIQGAQPQVCKCLSAVATQPSDARIGWETKKPEIDSTTQMVIAFQSLTCPGAGSDSLGAAYRGYEKSEKDVIVMIEAAKPGRPAIRGALIPRPKVGGKLLVKPVPATLPWGHHPKGGSGLCSVPF